MVSPVVALKKLLSPSAAARTSPARSARAAAVWVAPRRLRGRWWWEALAPRREPLAMRVAQGGLGTCGVWCRPRFVFVSFPPREHEPARSQTPNAGSVCSAHPLDYTNGHR